MNKLWIKIAVPIVLLCWLLLEVLLQITLNAYIAGNRRLIAERLRDVATAAAQMVDGDEHDAVIAAIKTAGHGGSDSLTQQAFQRVVKPLSAMRSALGYAEHWYTLTASATDTTTFGVMTHPKPFTGDQYVFRDAGVAATFHRALRENHAGSTDIYKSDNGVWLSGMAPIHNAQGKAVAVLEVDVSYKEYLAIENNIRNQAWIVRGVGVLASLVLGFLMGRWLAKPIATLTQAVHTFSRRFADDPEKAEMQIDLRRSDEIGELGQEFNAMAANLRKMASLTEQERRRAVRKAEQAAEDARNEVIEQQFYLEAEVRRIGKFLDAVRHNDLSRSLRATKQDAVGELVEALNDAIAAQRTTIVQMQEAASNLALVSEQIAVSSERIASQSRTQSTSVADIATSIEGMSQSIRETAKNVGQTSDVSSSVVSAAKTGQQAVEKTLESMTTISTVVESMAGVVMKLGQSSEQIGEIVETIEEIADQTTLLALNAAIEAARAGESGKGFAVVADEVRKLAEKTQKATKRITETIHFIQQDTKQATDAASVGAERVRQGIGLAQNAESKLLAIVDGIENVNTLIIQIATAAERQSSAAQEITDNIERIRRAIEANNTDIEGVARSVSNITEQASHLKMVAEQFILQENEHLSIENGAPSAALSAHSRRQLKA
jgi:methyl-accepting chemotaxis protein